MRKSVSALDIIIALIIVTSIAFAFAPTVHSRFVDWDDFDNFVKNPWFAYANGESFLEVWRSVVIGVYQPLAWTALLLQRLVFGVEARGFHIVSVILHTMNSLLVYRLTLSLLQSGRGHSHATDLTTKFATLLATLAIMIHPLKVEVVAWASCQPYLWAAMWALACLCLYTQTNDSTIDASPWIKRLPFVFFVFSSLSKTWAIGIPLILLLLDYYPLERYRSTSFKRLMLEKTQYFLCSILTVVIGIWARSHAHEMHSFSDRSLFERLARVGIALHDYALHIVWPLNLAAFYPEPTSPDFLRFDVLSGYCIFGCLLLVAWIRRAVWPGMVVAWLSFLILIFPNLGFVPTGRVTGADRYTYLATISLTPILAYSVDRLTRYGRKAFIVVGLCCAVAGITLIKLTRQQSTFWSDSITLWQRSLDMAPDKTAELYFNVARSLQLAGQLDEAIKVYHQSLNVDPNFLKSLQNLGAVHLGRREYQLALPFMEKLLVLKPDEPGALSNLGLTLSALGRTQEAHDSLLKAVNLAPTKPDFTLNLALFYVRINRYEKSLQIIDWFKSQSLADQRLDLVYVRVLLRLQRFADAQKLLAQVIPMWRNQGGNVQEFECLNNLLQTETTAGAVPNITDETCKNK